jgi:bacillithiol biosynthesis cysteine-adding enzyme BshC
MNITVERIPLGGSPLARAFIQNFDSVAQFYSSAAPTKLDSYRLTLEKIRDIREPSDWQGLEAANDSDDPNVRERLNQVIEGQGAFVATGQQAGLFVSPFYTLYKALTAARLASQLQEALSVPVMPMFTVASEDHDWIEVNHTHVVNVENKLVRIAVDGPSSEEAASPPVEQILLGKDVEAALGLLSQSTADSEFKASVLHPLQEAYKAGRPMAHAFQQALGSTLRRFGFLISRTAHPFVKQRTRDLLWAEWERREEADSALLQRAAELEAAGYQTQVGVTAGTTNLFVEGEQGRDRLVYEGDIGRLRRSGNVIKGVELRQILDTRPERVSPGALLRPVTEARAFPVVAYVGGPAEIAYLAQSQVLFQLHDVPAPVVVPRAAFRLIEPKVSRVLEKYELSADDLAGDSASTIGRIVKAQVPPELRESLDALREAVNASLEDVRAAAIAFDPGAKSATDSGSRAVLGGINDLESRLQTRVKEKNQVMQQQLEKVAVNLYPNGKPQERVLNPYPYLIRYGDSLLDAIYEDVVTPLG